MKLGVDDFRRVAVYPKAVLIGTASQFILLPLLAAGLILMLAPPPHIAAGMILLAACPGGAIFQFLYLSGWSQHGAVGHANGRFQRPIYPNAAANRFSRVSPAAGRSFYD